MSHDQTSGRGLLRDDKKQDSFFSFQILSISKKRKRLGMSAMWNQNLCDNRNPSKSTGTGLAQKPYVFVCWSHVYRSLKSI